MVDLPYYMFQAGNIIAQGCKKSGGVRNTACQNETEMIATPKKGAMTGVKRKIVNTRDMMRAIVSTKLLGRRWGTGP